MMRFGSVCSGIEAASVAWLPLGWRCAWLSEIEPFCCALLGYHYPTVMNYGDMCDLPDKILSGEVESPDLLCGGTPCQAFSIAGLRQSLDDERGNLSLVFCEVVNAIDSVRADEGKEPCIVFWENVPGVLNTKDNAFGCFLAGLAGSELPFEVPSKWSNAGFITGGKRQIAWRLLDAQYFGVPQRRKRIFVVASAREGFDPSKILFEYPCVQRNTGKSKEKRKDTAAHAESSTGACGEPNQRGADGDCGKPSIDKVGTLTSSDGAKGFTNNQSVDNGFCVPVLMDEGGSRMNTLYDKTGTLRAAGYHPPIVISKEGYTVNQLADTFTKSDIAGTITAKGGCFHGGSNTLLIETPFEISGHSKSCRFKPSKEQSGTVTTDGRGYHGGSDMLIATYRIGSMNSFGMQKGNPNTGIYEAKVAPTVTATSPTPNSAQGGLAICLAENIIGRQPTTGGNGNGFQKDVSYTLNATGVHGVCRNEGGVRRLTPKECERLQGFPDNYTQIPYRGKPKEECPDTPRYKAIGNSWAVPVVSWIGKRIDMHLRGEL